MHKARILYLIILGFVIINMSNCTSKPSTVNIKEETMISREHQKILSSAAENAFRKVSFPNLKGKKVFIEIVGLTFQGEEQIKQEPFIRSFVEEQVAKAEGLITDNLEKANTKVTARVKIFGADITSHGIPVTWFPLFYRDRTIDGTVSIDLIITDLKEGTLIASLNANGGHSSKRMYFLFLVGPFYSGR